MRLEFEEENRRNLIENLILIAACLILFLPSLVSAAGFMQGGDCFLSVNEAADHKYSTQADQTFSDVSGAYLKRLEFDSIAQLWNLKIYKVNTSTNSLDLFTSVFLDPVAENFKDCPEPDLQFDGKKVLILLLQVALFLAAFSWGYRFSRN